MKTIKVIVPRTLVKKHYPHPEPYGESMVELINGMNTDVYTDEKGYLYTITNDTKLIAYLSPRFHKDKAIEIKSFDISLRTLNFDDQEKLLEWFNNEKLSKIKYDINEVIEYISHSITAKSHQFIVKFKEIEIGYCGFSIIDNDANINLNLFDKKTIEDEIGLSVLDMLIDYIKNNHTMRYFSALIPADDLEKVAMFFNNGFQVFNILMIPISKTGYKKAYILKKSIYDTLEIARI